MDRQVVLALWKPVWHERDQSLVLGQQQRIWFCRRCAPSTDVDGNSVSLVLYNQSVEPQNRELRFATIVHLKNDVLGELKRVDADGLDYTFETVSEVKWIVNAEEEPGVIYDSDLRVADWSVWLTLSDVSEPVALGGDDGSTE